MDPTYIVYSCLAPFNVFKNDVSPRKFLKTLRASAIRVPKFGTLTCHISNNSNFMELTFQSVEL